MISGRTGLNTAILIGIPAVTFALGYAFSPEDVHRLAVGAVGTLAGLMLALSTLAFVNRDEILDDFRITRATIRLPQRDRDELLTRAMGEASFLLESDRGATVTFRQTGIAGLLWPARVSVTRTPNGIVILGQTGYVDKALGLLGDVVVSKEQIRA